MTWHCPSPQLCKPVDALTSFAAWEFQFVEKVLPPSVLLRCNFVFLSMLPCAIMAFPTLWKRRRWLAAWLRWRSFSSSSHPWILFFLHSHRVDCRFSSQGAPVCWPFSTPPSPGRALPLRYFFDKQGQKGQPSWISFQRLTHTDVIFVPPTLPFLWR